MIIVIDVVLQQITTAYNWTTLHRTRFAAIWLRVHAAPLRLHHPGQLGVSSPLGGLEDCFAAVGSTKCVLPAEGTFQTISNPMVTWAPLQQRLAWSRESPFQQRNVSRTCVHHDASLPRCFRQRAPRRQQPWSTASSFITFESGGMAVTVNPPRSFFGTLRHFTHHFGTFSAFLSSARMMLCRAPKLAR